jgi:sortase (surface protein transpeptidase)
LTGQVVAAVLASIAVSMIAVGAVPAGPPAPAPPTDRTPAAPSPTADRTPTGTDRAATAARGVTALPRSVPARIDIPAIDVHAPVMELGRNADGTIAVPPLAADAPAGWYRDLASPGEIGPAVILGHVDSATDGAAVFFRLGALRPGDTVSVSRSDGSVATFTVDDVAEYPKTAFPAAKVYGPIDHAGLRLITCGGDFDHERRSYRANIVVYATLARADPPPTARRAG